MAALLARRVRGALLWGIGAVAAAAWAAGLAEPPAALVAAPRWPGETALHLDFTGIFEPAMLGVVASFLFVDLFDTAGTLLGVGRLGGFTDERGDLPRADRAFLADALGTTVGGVLGTSPVTSYIESATGVEEGGRTGLTAVVVAVLFLLALPFAPLLTAVPAIATAPALVVVGALMMQGARDVEWHRLEEAVPALLTVVAMPFTYSIAHGISLGIVSYVAVRLLAGRPREIHPLLAVLAALLVAYHAWSA
jgi:AGZA family xanthine/uracil permease-like MFS transporter